MFERQGGRCALCGEPMPSDRWRTLHATIWRKQRPTIDHIVARSRGGGDGSHNLQLAHAVCNRRKGRGDAGRSGKARR
ncbi:HNH endonuclease [bacterium]|nr:HNH endonuclease [bacterium]